MEDLFRRAGFNYKYMEPYKFYDVRDKGIKVWSFNHETNKRELKLVTALVYKGMDEVYEVSASDKILFKGAAGHGLFVSNGTQRGEYQLLQDLSKSDNHITTLKNPDDPWTGTCDIFNGVKVTKTTEQYPILDIQVEDNQNYFSGGVLSHNTGGNSVKYFASTRNRVTKLEVLKDGKREVGIQIKVRNLKNKTSVPWREAVMNLYFDGGFQTDAEYVDFLMQFDLVQQKGAYFYVPGVEKGIQGKENLIEWLDANPEQYDKWKVQVLDLLSGTLDSDVENVDPAKEDPSEKPPVRGTPEAIMELAAAAIAAGIPEEETPPDLTELENS